MIDRLREKFKAEIRQIRDEESLEALRSRYLGRKGEITNFFGEIKKLAAEEKIKLGQLANEFKREIESALEEKKIQLQPLIVQTRDWLDITAPGAKRPQGHLHPRTQLLRQAQDIFVSLGFSVVDGPELETQWYNFEALNIPKDHPARDMQDTFYVKSPSGSEDLVMRTQTSPVQVRFMEKNTPPLRIIAPGRVFRREATDASHDYQFYQIEGLMVDKHISVSNFKAVMDEFFKRFYKQEVNVRLRPSYFPFTEPSFEIDVQCIFCHGRGCKTCGQSGWLEAAGAGMVNQYVFESAGYARNEWQGFAFGFGFERLIMTKYKINDIRLLSSGDMRFLKQF